MRLLALIMAADGEVSAFSAATRRARFSAVCALPQLPFACLQPVPSLPASARYELGLSSLSKHSAGTELARFSVVRPLPQLPFQAFTRCQVLAHQRGTDFAAAPINPFSRYRARSHQRGTTLAKLPFNLSTGTERFRFSVAGTSPHLLLGLLVLHCLFRQR
jgi:hypothetical protein